VENEQHVSHFPAHGFVFVSKTQKGGLAADRFAPAPGSFFDEKMLRSVNYRSVTTHSHHQATRLEWHENVIE
jgi:hypothetical protein